MEEWEGERKEREEKGRWGTAGGSFWQIKNYDYTPDACTRVDPSITNLEMISLCLHTTTCPSKGSRLGDTSLVQDIW